MKQALPFLISGTITAIVMTILSCFIEDSIQARSTLVSGLIVAITIMTIPIYDINQWSLFKRSLLHFVVMAITVFPLLVYSGWHSLGLSVVVFLLFGLVGWTIGYIVNRVQKRASASKEVLNIEPIEKSQL